MKKIALIFCLLIFTTSTYAIDSYDILWIKEDNVYVTTSPNATIYKTCSYGKDEYSEGYLQYQELRAYKAPYRKTINYTYYKSKNLRKPQSVKVRGYCNYKAQLHYDTYVVEIKDVLYYLPSQYVDDNNVLEAHNATVTAKYEGMFTEMDDLAEERDSLRLHYLNICLEQQQYYEELTQTLPHQIDSVKIKIEIDFENNKQAEFDRWYTSLPASTKNIYDNVLSISTARLHSQNSAGGCDCSVYYTNKSKKTIKYVYWTGTFYNAVNDPVYCDIRGTSTFTGQDTGPYAPNEVGGGVWDCVIYDWAADYVKLSNIRIIYTNGTSISIGAADIKRLLTYNDIYERIAGYGSMYDKIKSETRPYEVKLRDAESELKQWNSRLYWLKEPPVSDRGYEMSYYSPKENEKGEYKILFTRLYQIYKRRDALKHQIEEFEKRNFIEK